MKKSLCTAGVFLLALMVFSAGSAGAAPVTVNGIEFPRTFALEDRTLALRGAGMMRWAMLVDLYAGAFYLPESIPAGQWDRDIARHLELCYFRDIPAEGFVKSSQDHLQSTLPAERLAVLQPQLDDLYGLFRDVGAGDRYALTYQPDIGTTLSLNGEPLGTIAGSDFARAYFGIWLGDEPLRKKFRDRLLGISGS